MVKVAGLWELGWNTPIKELDLWEFLCKEFSVNELYMCPISGIFSTYVKERAHITDVINENPSYTVVWVDEFGNEELSSFIHPENALYIFGKSSERPMPSYFQPTHKSIKIITPQNTGLLWAHQALSIVLYDRMLKWQ